MSNSTIKKKIGKCDVCGKQGALTKRREDGVTTMMCPICYWQNVRIRSANKTADRESRFDDEDVKTLKNDLDGLFSKVLRMEAADEEGLIRCYICDFQIHWKEAQVMHFVKRGNSFLRYDTRNCKVGCKRCNEILDGNLVQYAKRLEEENPGITEILLEEANLVHKPSRYELKQMISEYSQRRINLKDVEGKPYIQ